MHNVPLSVLKGQLYTVVRHWIRKVFLLSVMLGELACVSSGKNARPASIKGSVNMYPKNLGCSMLRCEIISVLLSV